MFGYYFRIVYLLFLFNLKLHFISVNPISVFGTISLYAVSVFLIFGVTLTCFPAITVLVQSVNVADHKEWACSYFIPVRFLKSMQKLRSYRRCCSNVV